MVTIVCCAVLCLIFSIDILVSLTQNGVIYTKLTTPKKQQTNVGLQKGIENAVHIRSLSGMAKIDSAYVLLLWRKKRKLHFLH
jgi:hypothetical protein